MYKINIIWFDHPVNPNLNFESKEEVKTFIKELDLKKSEYKIEKTKLIPLINLIIVKNTVIKLCGISEQHNCRSILRMKLTSLLLELGKELRKF